MYRKQKEDPTLLIYHTLLHTVVVGFPRHRGAPDWLPKSSGAAHHGERVALHSVSLGNNPNS